jgi:hypothetical protein
MISASAVEGAPLFDKICKRAEYAGRLTLWSAHTSFPSHVAMADLLNLHMRMYTVFL